MMVYVVQLPYRFDYRVLGLYSTGELATKAKAQWLGLLFSDEDRKRFAPEVEIIGMTLQES